MYEKEKFNYSLIQSNFGKLFSLLDNRSMLITFLKDTYINTKKRKEVIITT